MTLLESQLQSNIVREEFWKNGWSKETAKETSPNILNMIEHYNRVTAWIETLVLVQENIDSRTAVTEYLIEIADHCRKLQNFQTCSAIINALEVWTIHRLPKKQVRMNV